MTDPIVSPADRITRQAFHEFRIWTQRFSRMVRERASILASPGGPPGVITSQNLVEAVRAACEHLAAEIDALDDGCSSSAQRDRRAA